MNRALTATLATLSLAIATLVPIASASATSPAVTTDRIVTRNAEGVLGNNSSTALYATPDFGLLFIQSQADNLVPSAQNQQYAVHYYVADTVNETISQFDLDANGHGISPQLQIKTVSQDLRYVLYTRTLSNGTVRDELVDRSTGAIVTNICGGAQELCFKATISPDNRYVFYSVLNLGSYNVPIGNYVFASYEIATTHRQLRATAASPSSNQVAFNPKVSSDGWVYYNSYNLGLTGDPAGHSHIVRESIATGVTQVVDATASGVVGNRDANDFALSPDGRFITFNTLATNFAAGDANGQWRPYLKDLSTGALTPLGRPGSNPNYVITGASFQIPLGSFTSDNSLVLCSYDPTFVPEGTGAILRSPDGTLRWFSRDCAWGISADGLSYVYLDQNRDGDPSYQGQQVHLAPIVFPGTDTTPPVVSGTADPAANAAGWSPIGTVITWSATDDEPSAGTPTTPPPTTVTTEGAQQTVESAPSCDPAGNCSTGIFEISVDATPPVLTSDVQQAPNASGWYRDDVTFRWSCGDALSGVQGACPADSTITGEGSGLVVKEAVADQADNVTGASTTPVNIDRTAPVTSVNAPTGWSQGSVTVTLSAADNLSGVATTTHSLDGAGIQTGASVTIEGEGTHTLAYRSIDEAGNAEALRTTFIELDYSGPILTVVVSPSPNAAGWNSTPVTVSTSCVDNLSGVAQCSVPATVTEDGRNQTISISGTDNAGNVTARQVTVNIDRVAPQVTIDGPTNGLTYELNSAPGANCSTLDALSGVSTAATLTLTRTGSGDYVATCSGAVDAAGNAAASVTVTYRVVPTVNSLLALTYQYLDETGSGSRGFKTALAHSVRTSGCAYPAQVRLMEDWQWITPTQADELIYWSTILRPGCP